MAKKVKLDADTLEDFITLVENEMDEYRRYCTNPEDVEAVFGKEEVQILHSGIVVKRFVNPYNGDWLWQER